MASSVLFPLTDEPNEGPVPVAGRRAPHLPFRRISLPAVPSQAALAHARASYLNVPSTSAGPSGNRTSVISVDSLPEDAAVGQNDARYSQVPAPKARRSKPRPSSLQPLPRRPSLLTTQADHKRAKLIKEFLDTEKTYVDGLDLVYDLFLEPLIASVDQPRPLLTRNQLTSVFSNLIEIWNFHRSFYTALNEFLSPYLRNSTPISANFNSPSQFQPTTPITTAFTESPPGIASLLLEHFHYLSLYHPYVTAYPTVMATLDNFTNQNSTNYHPAFSDFIKQQQRNPRCKSLGLRDWLLTVIQRIPRYELMVKDLVVCTDTMDPEHGLLEKALALVIKINISLNAALQTQTVTLSLVAIQRATPNLPFPFIEPGRSFIRRGTLLQIGDRLERVREFFLFTDCLVWLSRGGEWEGIAGREEFLRPSSRAGNRSENERPVSGMRRSASSVAAFRLSYTEEEKWWFRGRADLMDLEVVVPLVTSSGEDGRFEILNPEMSFALYAESQEERKAWTSAIRSAKEARLISLNVTNMNTTLTSSSSTQHLRRALQALPYHPDSDAPLSKKLTKKEKSRERRGKVEHFVPAIWVPDAKAESCMRCGGVFGWRRRRHHCRLCGRCVCASCSGKTFFITDTSKKKEATKPARACNACYDTVFPVVEPEESTENLPLHMPHYSSIGTLTALPASKSMPSLLLADQAAAALAPQPLEYSYPVTVIPREGEIKERPKSGINLLGLTKPPSNGVKPPNLNRLNSYTTPTAASAVNSSQDALGEVLSTAELVNSSSSRGEEQDLVPPISMARNSISYQEGSPSQKARASFSLPAVAVHTAAVTTRPSMEGEGRSRRISLVINGKSKISNVAAGQDVETKSGRGKHLSRLSLDRGAAVGKLNELLGRK